MQFIKIYKQVSREKERETVRYLFTVNLANNNEKRTFMLCRYYTLSLAMLILNVLEEVR